MTRWPKHFLHAALFTLAMLLGRAILAQDLPMRPTPELVGDASASSLKICLRLQDETPFLGIASVHVLPDGVMKFLES